MGWSSNVTSVRVQVMGAGKLADGCNIASRKPPELESTGRYEYKGLRLSRLLKSTLTNQIRVRNTAIPYKLAKFWNFLAVS